MQIQIQIQINITQWSAAYYCYNCNEAYIREGGISDDTVTVPKTSSFLGELKMDTM